MDSDSDSGGSHISATPPPISPPPSLRQKPITATAASTSTSRPVLKFESSGVSHISTTPRRRESITAVTTSTSRPVLKFKSSKKKQAKRPENPEAESNPVEKNPPEISLQKTPSLPEFLTLPFLIRCPNHETSSFSRGDSVGPAFGAQMTSGFGSFAKTRRESVQFEPVEAEPDVVEKTGNENSMKRKHPNGIADCAFYSSSSGKLSAPKKVKTNNEGNFVRLNINGYGRSKFKFKGNRKSFGSSSSWRPRFSRRKNGKAGAGAGPEGGGEMEGLVVGMKGNEKRLNVDAEKIEEAVMNARNEASDANLSSLLKLSHGYDSFRDGQLEAVKMVLEGRSTMLVLPTGAGKSLCYQLPALILPGITLVVSPLVALMIDQLNHLPPAIPGGLLCSSQTLEEASETLKLLQEQAIKVLFISPERLLNGEFTSIFSESSGPVVSLVVIDEAHCVSEWSHNFRPSYMRLRASVLHSNLQAQCILAMTATATIRALNDVMHSLEIPASNLIQSAKVRDNLQLSLSMTENRMKDLMTLLKSPPFLDIKSIIIYCKFQFETDTISKYLSDKNIRAKSYHSSIPAKERRCTQEQFCKNKIRVVVATVAFGMGLDKKDIGAVIHYGLPGSLEEYVQEIGRAGRDGRSSYCHLFFDDYTYFKMRSLMHSDGIDEFAVNKFLSQIFHDGAISCGKICSFNKEPTSRKFDIKEEVMLTILTQLEIGEVQYLKLLPEMNVTCTVNFHQTSPGALALKDLLVAAILKKSELKDGQYVFDIPNVANSLGLHPSDLSNHLFELKLKGEITYELKDQAYCYTIVDVPSDICSLAANTAKWLSEVEMCKVQKLDAMYNAAAFAMNSCNKADGCGDGQHTPCLTRIISEYFNKDDDSDIPNKMGESSRFLNADIKVFLQSHSQAKFTPRAVARIMHGIGSPAFPSATWSKTHFWGRYIQTDFKVIMEAAKAELIKFVSKSSA